MRAQSIPFENAPAPSIGEFLASDVEEQACCLVGSSDCAFRVSDHDRVIDCVEDGLPFLVRSFS